MTRILRDGLMAALAFALLMPRGAGAAESRVDSMPLPPPAPLSYHYDALQQGVIRPLTRACDLSLLVRKLGAGRREAANLDARDRVLLPSTWWQPRVGFKPVSVAAMLTGAGPGTGPAPGPWTVVAAKGAGVSKGFTVKDSTGTRFAMKFDTPDLAELSTGADVVASKLYWAAGYNVPDNTIASFRREDLRIAPKATRTSGGKKVPITAAYLDELLRDVPRQPDGRYRVVASRYLAGKPLDEWRYDGRREGDAEDLVPHELRREIRGLWVINAWINHTDCSARNTLDMYVTDGGRSFVRHHLLDFSGCLGSASIAAQPQRSGHEYWIDFQTIAKSFGTLAVLPHRWERSIDPDLMGVGFIDADTFDPGTWRPYLANPAFDARTDRDTRWGARIVAAFSDAQIRAAVAQGQYRDPRASEYLAGVLEARRDKIARRWLTPEEAAAARSSWGADEPAAAPADSTAESELEGHDASSRFVAPDSSMSAPILAEPVPVIAPRSPERLSLGGRAKRAAGGFLSDGWVIVSSPFRARGAVLAWTGVAIGMEAVLYANDQEVFDAAIRNRENPAFRALIDVGNTIEPVGFMGRTNPIYLGVLGAGYAFNVRFLRTIPTEILESHLLAGGVRNLGKAAVGRSHPYQNAGPHQFEFGKGTSFPSGHTSVAFELATIASMHARLLPVTIVAYSLATTLALQRVESGNHWPSDVFISALYGTLIARTVVKLHAVREDHRRLGISVLPRVAEDGRLAGVQLVRRF